MIKDFFRKKYGKVLLFLITVSFILSSIGGILFFSNKYNVLVIDNNKISFQKFSKLLIKEREAAYYSGETDVDYLLSKEFTIKSLEKIKNSELLNTYIKNTGLSIKKEDIFNKIAQNKDFQTNDVFDSKKYKEFLQNVNISEDEYIESVKTFYLNMFILNMFDIKNNFDIEIVKKIADENNKHKIVNLYKVNKKNIKIDKVSVSEKEMKDYYNNNILKFTHDEKRKIDYIKIDLTKTDKKISEEEIEKYYNDNINKYKTPESYDIYYLESEQKAKLDNLVKSNKNSVLSNIKKILGKEEKEVIINGLSVDIITYIFGESAKKVNNNEFSEIIEKNGKYIAFYLKNKNDEKVINLNDVKQDIIAELQKDISKENIRNNYNKVQNLITKNKTLKNISEVLNLNIETFNYITVNDNVKGLKVDKYSLFSSNENEIVPAFSSDNHYYLYSVADIEKSYVDRFDDVKNTIETNIRNAKENKLYLSKVSVENRVNYEVLKRLVISKDSNKYDENFISEIYRLKNGSFTNIYYDNDSLYFAEVVDEKKVNENDNMFISHEHLINMFDKEINNNIGHYFIKYLSEKYSVYINSNLLKYF